MSWLNSGIDWSLPGNGGEECLAFHTPQRRFLEAALCIAFCSGCFYFGYSGLASNPSPEPGTARVVIASRFFSRFLGVVGVLMTIVYILEIGYKFFTLQVTFVPFLVNQLEKKQMTLIYLSCAKVGPIWNHLSNLTFYVIVPHGSILITKLTNFLS